MSEQLRQLQHLAGWLVHYAQGGTSDFPPLEGIDKSTITKLGPHRLRAVTKRWCEPRAKALQDLRGLDTDNASDQDAHYFGDMVELGLPDLARSINMAAGLPVPR